MPSKAEQIAARVAAVLLNTTAAGAHVWRDRETAFTRDEPVGIVIECVDEDTTPLGGPSPIPALQTDQDTLRVAVTVCVRSAGWQTVADGVRVQAHALLMADTTLRGLVSDMRRDRCEWQAAKADLPFGYCSQIYRFKYHTRAMALDSSL